jgi:hypothetical protein
LQLFASLKMGFSRPNPIASAARVLRERIISFQEILVDCALAFIDE